MENNEDYKPTINISFDDYYDVISQHADDMLTYLLKYLIFHLL